MVRYLPVNYRTVQAERRRAGGSLLPAGRSHSGHVSNFSKTYHSALTSAAQWLRCHLTK